MVRIFLYSVTSTEAVHWTQSYSCRLMLSSTSSSCSEKLLEALSLRNSDGDGGGETSEDTSPANETL